MAITISGNGITSANIADGTITASDINSAVELGVTDAEKVDLKSGRKNLIINGGFDVWQRGTSATYPDGLTYKCVDRWRFQRTATSKVTTPYGQGVRITDNAQGGDMMEQVIEETAVFKAGVSFTLSFYVRSSVALTDVPTRVWGVVTGSGSSVISETYNTTTDWVRKTFTGTAPVDLLEDMRVSPIPSYDLSTGQWMEFANVQLELGSVATDFEHRSFGEELALCQRYYFKSAPALGVGSLQGRYMYRNYEHIWLAVRMRGTPTFTSSSSFAPNRIFHDGWTNDASPTGGDMLVCELDAEL